MNMLACSRWLLLAGRLTAALHSFTVHPLAFSLALLNIASLFSRQQ